MAGSSPTQTRTADAAINVCFTVKIDDNELGWFTSCDGLGCEVVLEQREEGGNNGFVWQLPTRIKYGNVKLTRPVGADSAKLTAWLASFVNGVSRRTGVITARTADGKEVASWHLDGVIPVRWSGPSLTTDGPKVATETIELAHHGFLPVHSDSSGAKS